MASNNQNTRRLTTCNSSFEARVLEGALNSAGIGCIVGNENMTNFFGMVSLFSGVDIFVLEEDYDKALAILNEAKANEPTEEEEAAE